MKKTKYILFAILIVAALAIAACEIEIDHVPTNDLDEPVLGGDTDEYGCKPSAGYTWCPSLNECVRVWETLCPEYEEYYMEPGMCTREYMPVLGDIIIPTAEGEKVIRKEFSNRCVAESAGAENIQLVGAQDRCDLSIGETYCPSLGECVQVRNELCEEFSEYYIEPRACTMEYMPVRGDITFPCDTGTCTVTMEFGNRCVAEAAGAENIEPINWMNDEVTVTNFEECVAQGNPIMESYPEQCAHEGVVYTRELSPEEVVDFELYEACGLLGGTYLEEHNECEYISQEACTVLGGEFKECESACRHDPDYPEVMCTTQCVIVCEFN